MLQKKKKILLEKNKLFLAYHPWFKNSIEKQKNKFLKYRLLYKRFENFQKTWFV